MDTGFYARDSVSVAKSLLGKLLCHETEDGFVSGIIVETEAYLSENDLACHANRGKTKRNSTMFAEPGKAYVYFIYGIYYCFNVVTGEKDKGEAVLVRALEPQDGLEIMKKNRGYEHPLNNLTSGPGKLCIALAISKNHDGHDLRFKPLYIAEQGLLIQDKNIISAPRIGISTARDKLLRFYWSGNEYISRRN